jgi:hypothetical protein
VFSGADRREDDVAVPCGCGRDDHGVDVGLGEEGAEIFHQVNTGELGAETGQTVMSESRVPIPDSAQTDILGVANVDGVADGVHMPEAQDRYGKRSGQH